MLKSEFQGKDFIEILNPGLKDPLVNCKIAGLNGIQKVYDKEIKGSIFTLDGIPTVNRITIPKDSKQGLGLVQRCVVFQLEIRNGQDFSMEISASDLNHNKRNLLFSTSHKDLNIQPLSARIPLKNAVINRGQWMNLVIDVASFITDIWKNQTFKIIDGLTVCANCKLRKIFSLKNVPSVELGLLPDTIIHQVDFPSGTDYKLQILTINDCRQSETIELSRLNSFDSTLSDSNSKLKNSYKIAFGTKVSVQNQQLNEKNSSKIDSIAKSGNNNEIATYEFMRTHRKKSDSESNSAKERSNDEDVLGNSNSSLKQSKQKITRLNNNNTKIQRINSSNSNEINEGNNFLETKKYPNPQPPTVPAGPAKPSPSARKARLSAKNTQNKQSNVNSNDKQSIIENISNNTNNNNNNNSLNESVTDLIQALKFNDTTKNNISSQQQQVIPPITKAAIKISPLQPKPPVATQISEKQNSSNVYSFSSKPKAVDFVENRKNQQPKTYDFRKYISNTPIKQKEDIIITDFEKSSSNNNRIAKQLLENGRINENNNRQQSISGDAKPFSIFSLLNEPINVLPNYQNIEQNNNIIPQQLDVTDSFEANLLKQLKEEMDEIPTKKAAALKPIVTKSKTSPIMFDNSNTSDKIYNYQVITNSCDTESTTSVLRKQKAEARFHNYENEMNTTTTAGINVHKSTTRDYSVMRSLLHSNSPNVFKNPINEERRYEIDSQATDNVSENSEDELNLVWDETLNCYYDPKTSTYYDMKS